MLYLAYPKVNFCWFREIKIYTRLNYEEFKLVFKTASTDRSVCIVNRTRLNPYVASVADIQQFVRGLQILLNIELWINAFVQRM